MRILHIIAEFGMGGAERVALMLVDDLVAHGHQVGLAAAPGFLDAQLPATVSRYRLVDRGRSAYGAAHETRWIAEAMRRFRPEVIHTHGVRVLAMALVAKRLVSQARAVPVLATHHATAPGEVRWIVRVLGRADHVVCVSGALAERLVAGGLAASRITVIHNAVTEPPPLSAEGRRRLDAELGLGDGPVISLVGRLEPQKRPERFVEVAAALAARDPAARFVVVGDGSLRSQTQALARRLGVDAVMRFTGALPDARAHIARSDALVFTSTWEGLSITALEALAAGVPVVATDTDGMRELLGDGAGIIVEDGSPQAIAQALTGLLADPGARARLGARGRELVRRGFAPEVMLAAYRRRYEALRP